jgi:hypothetical protein
VLPPSKNVISRIKQIEEGEFSDEIDGLMTREVDQLKEMYQKQQSDKKII